ncbi:unknown [Methanoculleus sp. CAG:1088]|nr:unknown [Methanoculleus sp. CAG:1088]
MYFYYLLHVPVSSVAVTSQVATINIRKGIEGDMRRSTPILACCIAGAIIVAAILLGYVL